MKRRNFIKLLGLGAVAGAGGFYFYPDEGILNPCLTGLPEELLNHDIVLQAWDGIDATLYRDVHTHLIGSGDSDSGIYLHSSMTDVWRPGNYVRYKIYMNAGCVDASKEIDKGYVQSLNRMMGDFPKGAKCMLLAFDYNHSDDGQRDLEKSPFHTPNRYANAVAKSHSARFEWIASIHPYRDDCVTALEAAIKNGAQAVKWLPPVMGINPSSSKCDRMYEAMAKYNMPLLTHAGDEHAVANVDKQSNGNPLLLRRALEHGVRVIVAHCASEGTGIDLDKGKNGPQVSNFDLFARMMAEQRFEKNLFGEISAMTQLNRVGPSLQTVLQRDDWHPRLLNGSDSPLPGVMPLFSTSKLHELGYLNEAAVKPLEEIRQYNSMLYDFVLKRQLKWQGKQFTATIFETKNFFNDNKKIMIG